MSLPKRVARILVPVDFSETSIAAMDEAAFLAKAFGASVELLHVVEPMLQNTAEGLIVSPTSPAETLREHAARIAAEELDRLVSRFQKENILVTAATEEGIAWERIVRAGSRADLIVMGTHGRTGLSRFILGSVTDKVVARSPVPVMTVRGVLRETAADAVPVAVRAS